jgi:autotransporter-associated beta strand protein
VTFAGAGVGTMTGSITDGGAGGGSTSVSLIKTGSGIWTFSGNNAYSGPTTVNGGTMVLQGSAQNPVFGSGQPGANITNGCLVADHGIADVKSMLTAGYNEPTKFATGTLRSSAASANTGLGWKDDGTNVTVGYAYYGDANLDGTVSTSDFTAMSQHFGSTTANWVDGDFNYDGKVNALDFNAVATNFGQTIVAPADVAVSAPQLGSVVPEPASMGVLAIAATTVLSRRRRRA